MNAPHHSTWADPRLAEAYDLMHAVALDRSTFDDQLPELRKLMRETLECNALLAGVFRDRAA